MNVWDGLRILGSLRERYLKLLGCAVLVACFVAAGCSSTSRKPPVRLMSDMNQQPRFNPQSEASFFADGRATRPPVPGTVARGYLKEDDGFYKGANGSYYVARNPLPLNREVLARGQERFNIYCAPCHDRTGTGRGIVSQRSSWLAADLNDQRIREMADGQLFDVVSNGRRSMAGYRFQVSESDRWAIVAYVRALQRASSGSLGDVPPELRGELR